MKHILQIVLAVSLFSNAMAAQALYPFESKQQEAQFGHLLKELRCLVCQNQDLADSQAPLAVDLRTKVYEFVREGQTDSQIIVYLTERYGDFILFKPPLKGLTLLLWLGPLFFVAVGMVVFMRTFKTRGELQ